MIPVTFYFDRYGTVRSWSDSKNVIFIQSKIAIFGDKSVSAFCSYSLQVCCRSYKRWCQIHKYHFPTLQYAICTIPIHFNIHILRIPIFMILLFIAFMEITSMLPIIAVSSLFPSWNIIVWEVLVVSSHSITIINFTRDTFANIAFVSSS